MHPSDESYYIDKSSAIISLAHQLAKKHAISFAEATEILKIVTLKDQEENILAVASSLAEIERTITDNGGFIAEHLLTIKNVLSSVNNSVKNVR